MMVVIDHYSKWVEVRIVVDHEVKIDMIFINGRKLSCVGRQ
jgi:hypothetical protein